MSSKTNIHVYFFANYFLDGIEISTIQIAKWFRFLSPLLGSVMVGDFYTQGHRFAHPCLLSLALSGLKSTNVRVIFLQLINDNC